MNTQSFHVKGLSCSQCVDVVAGVLRELPDVHAVEVQLSTGLVTLQAAQEVSPMVIRMAVEEVGYEVDDAPHHGQASQ